MLASRFARSSTDVDHWIAFGLLLLIGLTMVWEAVRGGEDTDEDSDALGVGELLDHTGVIEACLLRALERQAADVTNPSRSTGRSPRRGTGGSWGGPGGGA